MAVAHGGAMVPAVFCQMTWFPRGTEKRALACQDLSGCGGGILLALPFEKKPVWRLSHAGSDVRDQVVLPWRHSQTLPGNN